jgi:uncharacterized membrane protein YbhN (UPF0104 family)
MKPSPEEALHADPLEVETVSKEPASDARPRSPKLWLAPSLSQAGPRRRALLFWLRFLAGVGVLGLILSRLDRGDATVRVTPMLLTAVLAATMLLIMSQAVAALRWKLVLGEERLPWTYFWRLYLVGSFFGLFLPTSVGGDAVRAAATARLSGHAGRALASVVIDRGFGVVATIGYGMCGLMLAASHANALLGKDLLQWRQPDLTGAGLLFATAGVAVVILSRAALGRLWQQGLGLLGGLARSPLRLGAVSVLAVVSQGLIVLLWYTLALGVSFVLPLSAFLWAVPLVSLSALLPVTFSGLGVREGAWLVLLAGSGIPSADVVVFSLLYFVCTLLVGITGAVLFVWRGMAPTSPDRMPV